MNPIIELGYKSTYISWSYLPLILAITFCILTGSEFIVEGFIIGTIISFWGLTTTGMFSWIGIQEED